MTTFPDRACLQLIRNGIVHVPSARGDTMVMSHQGCIWTFTHPTIGDLATFANDVRGDGVAVACRMDDIDRHQRHLIGARRGSNTLISVLTQARLELVTMETGLPLPACGYPVHVVPVRRYEALLSLLYLDSRRWEQ